MTESRELPQYTVRQSARARRVSVVVRPGRGVEVVLPRGVDPARAEDVVRRKGQWIAAALERMGMSGAGPEPGLPRAIHLLAVDREYVLGGVGSGRGRLRLVRNQGRRLEFVGKPGQKEDYTRLLQAWLAAQGRRFLPPLLRELSRTTGLACERIQIRRQQTRWGSCSAKGTISLNCKMLFLAPELARYVLAHELAHTVRLDHSPAFWSQVEAIDPCWREHEAALKGAMAQMPWWAH